MRSQNGRPVAGTTEGVPRARKQYTYWTDEELERVAAEAARLRRGRPGSLPRLSMKAAVLRAQAVLADPGRRRTFRGGVPSDSLVARRIAELERMPAGVGADGDRATTPPAGRPIPAREDEAARRIGAALDRLDRIEATLTALGRAWSAIPRIEATLDALARVWQDEPASAPGPVAPPEPTPTPAGPAPAARAARPVILIIGTLSGQFALIRQRCERLASDADLIWVDKNRKPTIPPSATHAIQWKFTGHAWDTFLKPRLPKHHVHYVGGGIKEIVARVGQIAADWTAEEDPPRPTTRTARAVLSGRD